MSAPFAAGPWKQCGANDSRCQCGLVWSVSADVPVAKAYRVTPEDCGAWSPETQAANASLIAAAPDLYAALLVARDHIKNSHAHAMPSGVAALGIIDAALKKVDGP